MAKTKPIQVTAFDAAEYLKDETSIAAFLNASREMNDPAVLLNALATVARARSMTDLAAESGLGRESLYKALRPGAQPRYDTVMRVMDALGVEVVFQPKRAKPAPAKAVARVSQDKAVEGARTDNVQKEPRTRSRETRAIASRDGGERPARRSSRSR